MSKKFTISFNTGSGVDIKNVTVTVSNPKNGITDNEVVALQQNLGTVYDTDFTLKTAKYVETSETYVYPEP